MAILNNPEDFTSGENVTAAKLNNLVDGATFLGGAGEATDGSTLEVNDGVGGDGSLRVKDLGITTAKLADSAVSEQKIADSAVTSGKIADDAVTFTKMQNIASSKVIGRITASSGSPEEVSILDEDAMSSNSDTSLATQQSIKAYVDSQVSQGLNKYDTGWVDQDDQLTPVSVGDGATMVFNHGLGSDALASVFSVYAAESATGTNMEAQAFEFYETTTSTDIPRGIQIKSITATQVTIQLGGAGYSITSAGNYGSKNWGTSASQLSHVRLVLIA